MRECASPGHQTVHQPSVQLQYSNKTRHCLNIHVTDCVVVLLQMDILFFYSSLPVGCNIVDYCLYYLTSIFAVGNGPSLRVVLCVTVVVSQWLWLGCAHLRQVYLIKLTLWSAAVWIIQLRCSWVYFFSVCRPRPTIRPSLKAELVCWGRGDCQPTTYRVVGLVEQLLFPVKVVGVWSVTDLWHRWSWPWTVCFIPFCKWVIALFYIFVFFMITVLINYLLKFYWFSFFAHGWDGWSN